MDNNQYAPLSDSEMIILKRQHTQNFDDMTIKATIQLLHMLNFSDETMKTHVNSEAYNLLLRRLHMIIDWTNYPERLI